MNVGTPFCPKLRQQHFQQLRAGAVLYQYLNVHVYLASR